MTSNTPHPPLPPSPDAAGKQPVSAQLRGETMAYAAQTGALSLFANVYEPWLNSRIQKHYSSHSAKPEAYGGYWKNFGGELAGDVTGFGSLMLAEMLFPEQLHSCTRKMRSWVDPLYSSVAHRVFADEKDSPDYAQKVDAWKTFQERNLVRSTIMAATGITGNVAAQKWVIHNESPTKVIFLGKLATTALTTALGLTARLAFPDGTKNVDRWMSTNIFAPMLDDGKAR
jgi:hypothetical protein